MKTIGIGQSSSNSALLKHRCIKNIKKLYQHDGKCDDQQQFKDILEEAMVSTPEGFTNNSTRFPMTPTQVKKPSARKPLCLFTNILHVKKKTAIHRVVSSKSKHRVMEAGTNLWEKNRKGNSKINDQINKYIYNRIMPNTQVVKSPIFNNCLKVNIDGHTRLKIVTKLLL